MTLITPPAALPIARIQWQLRQPHQVNRSGWTGRRQVSTSPGAAFWSCSAEFVPQRGPAIAKKWRGFFAALNGQVNYFPVIAVEAAQHAVANPTIVGGGAAGNNQVILSSTASGLRYGDMMTIKLVDGSYQLVALTGDLATTTATFMPPLRAAAATGPGSVETIRPYAHVALVSDVFEFEVQRGQVYGFSFTAEEVIG